MKSDFPLQTFCPLWVKCEQAWAEEDAQAKLAPFCILSYPFSRSMFFVGSLLIDCAQQIPDAKFCIILQEKAEDPTGPPSRPVEPRFSDFGQE